MSLRALLGCLLVVPTALAQEPSYPVRFSVASKVGDRRKVDTLHTQLLHRVTKKDDKQLQEVKANNKVEFKAVVEVLGVEKGRETKLQITVEKLVLIADGGEPREALKPGSVVLAETANKKTVFAPKDKEQKLSPLAERILPRLVSTSRGEVTENEVFKNDKPQKVGATWPADPKELAEQFKSLGKLDMLAGTAKLAGIQAISGKEYLELQATYSLKGPGPAGEGLVPGGLSVLATLRRVIPADYSTGPIEENLEVKMTHIIKGKPGSPNAGLLVDGSSTDTTATKITYLKK
jgi:hypothetical protein